jgi:predicted DNA-binding transcriptional regulator AlpA
MPADTPGPITQQTPPALLTLALIRRHFVPAGERTLHRWISAGTFPKPDIALGGKLRYWKRETIVGWIDAQVAGGGR